MADLIKIRRDTRTNWETNNPILNDGELALESDTLRLKKGDGVTAWNSLKYINKEILRSNKIFYVNPAGNDDNSGLSSSQPFATVAKAFDVIKSNIDPGSYQPIIQLANGTYTENINFSDYVQVQLG